MCRGVTAAFLLLLAAESASVTAGLAQTDLRVYRGVNRLIVGTRQLKANESWSGPIFTDQAGNRHPYLKWGAGCFVTNDGLILTANHVVTEEESYFVGGWTNNGIGTEAVVVARDEKSDLALIKVKPPEQTPWITGPFVDSSLITEGTDVIIWAYLFTPAAFMQFLRNGKVSNVERLSGVDNMLYLETTAIDGTSGSPVFVRNGGQPVGIVSSKLTVGDARLPSGIIAVVPGERINAFLKGAGVPGYK